MFTQTLPILLSLLTLVAAHGFINEVVINGETIKGNDIGNNDLSTSIRSVSTQDPMKGADNPELSCGPGSQAAKEMSSINPGENIEFSWVAVGGAPWFHLVGPMLTYMAECGGDCAETDSEKAKWFKVEEAGVKEDGSTWYQADLAQGKRAVVTIPDGLASGNYLIRHEILALHNAVSVGGAEFYAGCVQLKVGGDGTEKPEEDELVLFPGAYTDEDAGLVVPDIYNPGAAAKYAFPGGDVVKLVSGGSSGGNDDDDQETTTEDTSSPTSTADDDDTSSPTSTADDEDETPSSPTSSSTAAEPTKPATNTHTGSSSGSCKLRRNTSSASMKKRGSYHPKRHSRIMRDLVSPLHRS